MSYIKLNDVSLELEDVESFLKDHHPSKIEIQLQTAPIKTAGVNGCQIGEVIDVIRKIVESFNSQIRCRENSLIITKLQEASLWDYARTKDRQERNVEGTCEN